MKALVSALALLVVAACGGGDDDAPRPTQTAIGTISGFGSVIVNGIRFDDSGARIRMDDAPATRDRLRVGMVVQIRGRINAGAGDGVADRIEYNACVRGPITAMNRVQNTVNVLGQDVQIDDDTVFDGVTLRDMNGFAIGDQVEVSCLHDRTRNQLRATRVERLGTFQNGVSELEVTGVVANLDLAAGTCTINGLTVNFAGVAPGSRPAGLADGMTVEAGGRNFGAGVLSADRLRDRDRDRLSHPDGDGLEIEGLVSDFVSMADFKVADQAVNAASAVIRNGTATDVVNGARVEAEGTMSNGVLMAGVLVLKRQTQVRIEAGLQAKDGTAGTVTLLGRTIGVGAQTELRDRLANADQPTAITLAALEPGDRLEVKAYQDESGNLIATRVERTESDAVVVVKAPADAKTPTTQLTLAGIAVTTGPGSRYRDVNGVLVESATFYDAVQVPPAVPTSVHARGVVADLATNVVDATRTVSTIGELEVAGD